MSQRLKVILAFAVVYVVWGSTYIAIRVGVEHMPSALFAGLRFCLAGGAMLIGLWVTRRPFWPNRRDLMTQAVAALFLLVGGNGLLVLSEKTVPSSVAALLVAMVPLWIAGLETFLPGGERLAGLGWLGVLIGLAGLAVLTWPQWSHSVGARLDPLGVGLVIVSSISWAAGTVWVRRRPISLTPLAATGWEMLLGGIFNLAIGFSLQSGQPITWSPALWGALMYLVVFGSLLAFTAFVWLLGHVSAAKVATYAYVNPVIAVFLGWWLLGEKVNASMLGGMGVILLGVLLVNSARSVRAH